MASDSHDMLDYENTERTERLKSKITQLKHFAVDIERETHEQNRLLDEKSIGFDNLFGLMANGRNRLNRLLMSNRGNRRLLCYFSIGLSIFLLFGYALITRALFSNSVS